MSRLLKNYANQVTNKYSSSHKGIDIVGQGSKIDDVICHTDGTVVYADSTYNKNNTKATGVASWGIRVIVQHKEGYYTAYNHLANMAVKKGQAIKKGALIGRMGNTGCAYGVHLHFEVMKGGQASSYRIDPTAYINSDLPGNSTVVLTPTQTSGKKLYLPASAQTWAVYDMNVQPVKKNAKAYLKPSKFGGLTYDILGYSMTNVAIIQTRDFGKVQIYVAPSTGAIIK